jgi:CheY-like chemotaxis protein/chemotaxis signal transduction protein
MEFPNEFTVFHRSDLLFHVLIVEDDSFFATSLSEFIKSKGMVAHIAQNGLEAQTILKTSTKTNSSAPTIDYVITDLEMPIMNGMDLLRWIRKTPETKTLPVIMCTAVGDESIRKEAQKLGIEYFSTKMGYEKIIDFIEIRRKQAQIGVTDENVISFDQKIEEVGADTTASILTFKVNGNLFGIEVENLKEISGGGVATEIPGMTKFINNMLGFRGNPIPILDLRQIDGQPADLTHPPHQIVALIGHSLCALWVDKVIDVRRLRRLNKSEAVDVRNFGKYMYLLISNVLWDHNEPIALISYDQLNKLLAYVKDRVKPLNHRDLKDALSPNQLKIV